MLGVRVVQPVCAVIPGLAQSAGRQCHPGETMRWTLLLCCPTTLLSVFLQARAIEQRILSELAPAPPSGVSTAEQLDDGDTRSEPPTATQRAAARLPPSVPPGLDPVQRLLPPRRQHPRAPPTRAQAILRQLQSVPEAAAAAGGGDGERALRAVVTRRLHQMVATRSPRLNLDLALAWTAADVPCILQCIQCASGDDRQHKQTAGRPKVCVRAWLAAPGTLWQCVSDAYLCRMGPSGRHHLALPLHCAVRDIPQNYVGPLKPRHTKHAQHAQHAEQIQ